MKEKIKRYLVFLFGLLMFGFGLAFAYRSVLGNDPMGIFVGGISLKTGLEIWLANLVVGLCEVAIGFILERKNVTLATLIGIVCGSYAINIGYFFIPVSDNLVVRIIYMLCAVLFYCLGVATQQVAHCGYSNLDCFLFGLKKAFHIEEYYKVRWIVDIAFFVSGYFLGGTVGVGTVLFVAFGGMLIQFFRKQLEKVIHF